jgi:hypothetical protein
MNAAARLPAAFVRYSETQALGECSYISTGHDRCRVVLHAFRQGATIRHHEL